MIYKKIIVINPAKVGSATFFNSLRKDYNSIHGHNLEYLNNILNNEENNLFICGVRNPVERNLSYFFQTYRDNYYNDFKTRKNNYKGEYCYNEDLYENPTIPNLIKSYQKFKYKYSYLDWLEEFLDIVQIKTFDKKKGYTFYNIKNNNFLLVYQLEKLEDNILYFEDYFGVSFINYNVNKDKIYLEVKNKIKYDKEEINKLLNNSIIKFFYSKENIDIFYNAISYRS